MLSVLAISLLVTFILCLNVKANIKTDFAVAMEQGLQISMNRYFDLQDGGSETIFSTNHEAVQVNNTTSLPMSERVSEYVPADGNVRVIAVHPRYTVYIYNKNVVVVGRVLDGQRVYNSVIDMRSKISPSVKCTDASWSTPLSNILIACYEEKCYIWQTCRSRGCSQLGVI
jgi:hypothetical protein